MNENIKQAEEFVVQANRKLRSTMFCAADIDKGIELLSKAANQYCICGMNENAANICLRIANIHLKNNENYYAARMFTKAGKLYKSINLDKFNEYLERAVELFLNEGKYNVAARTQEIIANTVTMWESTANLYKMADNTISQNKCLLKAAHLHALNRDYDAAIELYEHAINSMLNSDYSNYSVKNYIYRVVLCRILRNDTDDYQTVLNEYSVIDNNFDRSREYRFLSDIIRSLNTCDMELFNSTINEYDRVSKLDDWNVVMLSMVKEMVSNDDNLIL